MAQILLVRHAQSEWNVSHRWQGHADTPLSAHGRAQSIAAAKTLSTPDTEEHAINIIVASDLVRARETAEIIAGIVGVDNVIVDAGLRERDVGSWQGLTTAEIKSKYPGALANKRYPSGWENDETLLERMLNSLRRIIKSASDSNNILIVSHAGVFYTLERYFNHDFKPIGNLCGRRIRVTDDGFQLGSRVSLIEDMAEQ